MTQFPINILSSLQEVQGTKNLILEIRSTQSIVSLSQYGFTPLQIEKITHNLTLDSEKQKKTVIFSHISPLYDAVTCFFPSSTLMDDRSSLFSGLKEASVFVPEWDEIEALDALTLSTYTYETYLSKPKKIQHSIILSSQQQKIEDRKELLASIIWARDMINMPPRDMNPEGMVREIQGKKWKHFDVEVFDKKSLEKLGCNLLLAVGAGSANPPYMVVLKPKNPPKTEKYALIGKGVTFDAGGIQIKPDTAMLDMKCDMSGAAGMIGVAHYLDTLSTLPVDVMIAIWLTENMTGDDAFKPLDIYKSYNGTTVEIHHTDAEGRLVLADVMWYVEDVYKPEHIITMATLTGACIYALGHDIAGIMWDDEDVIRQLIANTSPYETVWRLPLNEKLKKSLKADIADLKNVARSEKAGSSVGWAFLSYFQGKAKLTHLDIAGPAYRETIHGYMPKGGTGWWVQMLSNFLLALSHK